MTDGVGKLDSRLLGPLSFEDVEGGPANPGSADLDDDIVGVGGDGYGYLGHFQIPVIANDLNAAHCGQGEVPSF